MEGRSRLGNDIENFPNANLPEDVQNNREAHAIQIETDKGQYYVMVILNRIKILPPQALSNDLTLLVLLLQPLSRFIGSGDLTRPIASFDGGAAHCLGDLTSGCAIRKLMSWATRFAI